MTTMPTKRRDDEEEEEGEKDNLHHQNHHHEEEEEDHSHDDHHEDHEDEGGDGGSDPFFESFDRVPSGISFDVNDLPSSESDSEDDNDDDVRISFASAVAPPSFSRLNLSDFDGLDLPEIKENDDNNNNSEDEDDDNAKGFDYGIWMARPMDMSVQERRRKLLQGMGLSSSKNLPGSRSRRVPPDLPPPQTKHRLPSSRLVTAAAAITEAAPPDLPPPQTKHRLPSSRFVTAAAAITEAAAAITAPVEPGPPATQPAAAAAPSSPLKTLDRSQSDTKLALPSSSSMAALFRVSSAPPLQCGRWARNATAKTTGSVRPVEPVAVDDNAPSPEVGVLKIKNLDTGKEFVVSSDNALVGKLKDSQTGLLTMDEFEKFLGSSRIVREVMRRVTDANTAIVSASSQSKSARSGKSGKKKANWLKNIKFVASTVTSLMSEKEREREREREAKRKAANSSERLKVHHHGKSYKELTGLYMCQEIQAHQGSIWVMKFSCDSRYMASAGEDRVVHVWQVIECDTLTSTLHRQDQLQPPSPGKQQPPLSNGKSSSLSRSNRSGGQLSKRTKKGKGSGVPSYLVMPETIFSLSAEPFCSLEGHTDDILDLSWSKSQCLLSSSMDKTVRLWDIETKTCLKVFAHSDYVTCIQFNPMDERYFISGSLDAKVRIWSVPERLVVDWTDLHEMVTATCYTPDGQGALVGSHKGSCRFYNTSDAKLTQERQIEITKKKQKSNPKKITGFQFAPDNQSEVLITSADSQIRVFDGVDMVHKFRGFRNTSSQISASCTMDGKYVVCASEDSHVYVWKRDRPRGKGKVTTRSHEHFCCKDVSVAIPWPNGGTNCEPSPDLPSWSRANHNLHTPSNLEDVFSNSRSHNCPSTPENTSSEDLQGSPRAGSAIGSSSSMSGSASLRSGHSAGSSISSSATSSSSFSSWGWGVGNSNRISTDLEAANAWGLVVVTAGTGGNIRVYQNFGLPLRLRGPPF